MFVRTKLLVFLLLWSVIYVCADVPQPNEDIGQPKNGTLQGPGNESLNTGNATIAVGNGTIEADKAPIGAGNGSQKAGNGTQTASNGTIDVGNGTIKEGNTAIVASNGTQTDGNGIRKADNGNSSEDFLSQLAEQYGDEFVFLIVGGYRPKEHTFAKHIVSIRPTLPIKFFGANHTCGGTLIRMDLVLTAAHCFMREGGSFQTAGEVMIVAGTPKRLQRTSHTVVRFVKRLIVHKEFNPANFLHDIAILHLSEPLKDDLGFVDTVAYARNAPTKDTRCTAVGWGRIFNNGPLADELLYVDLKIMSYSECRNTVPLVFSSMLCAGDKLNSEKDACAGDSGGPLFCNGVITGIVSYGIGCATPGYPGVYTDIASYTNWIARNSADAAQSTPVSAKWALALFVMANWLLRSIRMALSQ